MEKQHLQSIGKQEKITQQTLTKQEQSVIENNRLNYKKRGESFSNWAFSSEKQAGDQLANLFVKALYEQFGKDSKISVLDCGCGPGRDLLTFKNSVHEAVGMDVVQKFCDISQKLTGCKVYCQAFENMAIDQQFSGIFCLASLFHVPFKSQAKVLGILKKHLVPKGLLFSSFPSGRTKDSQMSDGRWGLSLKKADHQKLLKECGFKSLMEINNIRIYNGQWYGVISQKM